MYGVDSERRTFDHMMQTQILSATTDPTPCTIEREDPLLEVRVGLAFQLDTALFRESEH